MGEDARLRFVSAANHILTALGHPDLANALVLREVGDGQ